MEQNQNTDSLKCTERRDAPQGRAAARSAVRREDIAPTEVGAENKKKRAPHGSRNGRKLAPPPIPEGAVVPAFEPVPMKPRHDGWTPERQRAFIAALADTGSVTSAARYVNMSTHTAYQLRRHVGADSFRAAWTAALDLGVQRLKDEVFDRALNGQLHPVFIGGKLKGFKRVKNDRLLMFALRMNAKDEYGRRLAATYFDPNAPRLHGGSGTVDGGDIVQASPLPLGEGVGGGGAAPSLRSANPLPARITETVTGPAVTQRQKDAYNAALVAQFDPVAMTLPEIEAMQAMLVEAAQRKRAEEDGPPEHMTGVAFLQNRDEDVFKPVGPLEDIEPVATEEDREAEFDEDEERWWALSEDD